MDELRENVVMLVYRATEDETGDFGATECTDAILALPGIAEALDALAERRIDAMSPSRFGAALQNAKQPRSPGPKPDSRPA